MNKKPDVLGMKACAVEILDAARYLTIMNKFQRLSKWADMPVTPPATMDRCAS